MNASSPCSAHAAARALALANSVAASPPRVGWARVLTSTRTNNNSTENINKSTTPTPSTAGTSISMLTAGMTTTPINDGNDSDDIDFIKAGSGVGFDNNIVLGGEESGGEESGQGEEHGDLLEEELPPLRHIFDCAYIVVWVVSHGKEGWECRWCNKVFAPKHASCALRHILKIWKCDIVICKAAIPERDRKRYLDLYKANTEHPFGTRSIQFSTLH